MVKRESRLDGPSSCPANFLLFRAVGFPMIPIALSLDFWGVSAPLGLLPQDDRYPKYELPGRKAQHVITATHDCRANRDSNCRNIQHRHER